MRLAGRLVALSGLISPESGCPTASKVLASGFMAP